MNRIEREKLISSSIDLVNRVEGLQNIARKNGEKLDNLTRAIDALSEAIRDTGNNISQAISNGFEYISIRMSNK